MPRRPRLAAKDLAYHVLNRRVGRLSLFDQPADYAAFETTLIDRPGPRRMMVRMPSLGMGDGHPPQMRIPVWAWASAKIVSTAA